MELKTYKQNGNRYCGPAVISILTGVGSKQAAAVIRSITHERAVYGVHEHHMRQALETFGLQVTELEQHEKLPARERPTLAAWLRESKPMRKNGRVFLISGGGHFFIIRDSEYVDNLTSGKPVLIDEAKIGLRSRVRRVSEVTAPRGITMPDVLKPNPMASHERKMRALNNKSRVLAQSLAARYKIVIERDLGMDSKPYWVSHDLLEDTEHDPFDGDHYVHEWYEVLERVQAYVEALGRLAKDK